MTRVNVYLTFDGNCEEAFNFYKKVFKKEFSYLGRFKDIPQQEGMPPIPEDYKEKILHVALPISAETILFGSDAGSWTEPIVKGNNFSISIQTDSLDEASRLFNELSEGGKVIMPMNKTFWNAYFGMLTDKFGINWLINVDLNQNS
jgi:PhnB protein